MTHDKGTLGASSLAWVDEISAALSTTDRQQRPISPHGTGRNQRMARSGEYPEGRGREFEAGLRYSPNTGRSRTADHYVRATSRNGTHGDPIPSAVAKMDRGYPAIFPRVHPAERRRDAIHSQSIRVRRWLRQADVSSIVLAIAVVFFGAVISGAIVSWVVG